MKEEIKVMEEVKAVSDEVEVKALVSGVLGTFDEKAEKRMKAVKVVLDYSGVEGEFERGRAYYKNRSLLEEVAFWSTDRMAKKMALTKK